MVSQLIVPVFFFKDWQTFYGVVVFSYRHAMRVGWKWSIKWLVEEGMRTGLTNTHMALHGFSDLYHLQLVCSHYVMVALHYSILIRFKIFSAFETAPPPPTAFLVGNKITIFGTLVRIFVRNEVMRLSRASDQSVLSLIQQPIVVIVVGLETKNTELEHYKI